jgi:hypothetical protein
MKCSKEEQRRMDAAKPHTTVPIRFMLGAGKALELFSIAQWHGIPMETLAREIIMRYMLDRRRAFPKLGKKLTGMVGVPAQLAIVAESRLSVLKLWNRALRLAPKGKIDAATHTFVREIAQQRGVGVCKATLYNWKKRFDRLGMVGLIDHRKWKGHARLASGNRRQSAETGVKARSNGGQ